VCKDRRDHRQDAVAEVHRLLGIPKYARRLLRLLHADFESS
jgi:hypothetical protein